MRYVLDKLHEINLTLSTMKSKDRERYNSLLVDGEKKIFVRKMETSLLMVEFGNKIDEEDLSLVLEENKELIDRELQLYN